MPSSFAHSEVKKHVPPEIELAGAAEKSREPPEVEPGGQPEGQPAGKQTLEDAITLATSPAKLHSTIENLTDGLSHQGRGGSEVDESRFRVHGDESGSKRFLCIDVLPHFL